MWELSCSMTIRLLWDMAVALAGSLRFDLRHGRCVSTRTGVSYSSHREKTTT
jgi:hypothetical protein